MLQAAPTVRGPSSGRWPGRSVVVPSKLAPARPVPPTGRRTRPVRAPAATGLRVGRGTRASSTKPGSGQCRLRDRSNRAGGSPPTQSAPWAWSPYRSGGIARNPQRPRPRPCSRPARARAIPCRVPMRPAPGCPPARCRVLPRGEQDQVDRPHAAVPARARVAAGTRPGARPGRRHAIARQARGPGDAPLLVVAAGCVPRPPVRPRWATSSLRRRWRTRRTPRRATTSADAPPRAPQAAEGEQYRPAEGDPDSPGRQRNGHGPGRENLGSPASEQRVDRHPPRGCQTIGDRQPGTSYQTVIGGSTAQPKGIAQQRCAGILTHAALQCAWRERPQQLGTRGVAPLGARPEHWLLHAAIEIIRGEGLQERAPLSRARIPARHAIATPEEIEGIATRADVPDQATP